MNTIGLDGVELINHYRGCESIDGAELTRLLDRFERTLDALAETQERLEWLEMMAQEAEAEAEEKEKAEANE